MKIKLDRNKFKYYFYIIPFLHPRGIESFGFMKTFFTAWLYVSIAFILLDFVHSITKKKKMAYVYIGAVLLYHIVMLLITFIVRRSFSDALQKIFAAPMLCILCAIYLDKKPRDFISAINNILILLFLLSLTVFSPLLWGDVFNPIKTHYTFLGHIQISAQLGIVGLFLAYVENNYWPKKSKRKYVCQVALSLVIMAFSFTSASYIALILIAVFWLLDRTRLRKLFVQPGKTYLIVYLIINILLFWYSLNVSRSLKIGPFTLNGRGFIWKEALESFFDSPIYGYGVHGVMIKTFWSSWTGSGEGMNYMHNQILQVLNDGGLILLIPFLLMLYYMMQNILKVRDTHMKFWSTSYILTVLMIMVFESAMNYYYIFILLSVATLLPSIETKIKNQATITRMAGR